MTTEANVDTEIAVQEPSQVSPLDLSDEEMENYTPPDEIVEDEPEATEDNSETSDSTEDVSSDDEEAGEEPPLAADDDGGSDDTPQASSDLKTETEEEESTDSVDNVDTAEESTPAIINFEDEYNRLLAPFKANGKQMQVNSVDDALTLMQMGANYNKKMAGLKPNLKLMKMLENNALLDEDKLAYLIDLDKKDPAAIAKFIKESGIDLQEFDDEANIEYKPNTYTVNDKEVELDSVLADIKDTPQFQETIDIISNKWDDSSKEVLLETPTLIRAINDQVASGIYEQITGVIESERMLGRLTEVSDLEAYKLVGDAIQSQGGFATQPVAKAQEQLNVAPTIPKAEDPKLKSRRKAASTTKSAPSNSKKIDFNPLALSDEEFEKISGSQFL